MCQAQRHVCRGSCFLPFLTNSFSTGQDKQALPFTWSRSSFFQKHIREAAPSSYPHAALAWPAGGALSPGAPLSGRSSLVQVPRTTACFIQVLPGNSWGPFPSAELDSSVRSATWAARLTSEGVCLCRGCAPQASCSLFLPRAGGGLGIPDAAFKRSLEKQGGPKDS